MRNLGLGDLGFLGAASGAGDPFFVNISLLLHGDGANGSTTIIDSSPSPKTITAFGNAQISTAQSRFGGASIAFDGSGDYLRIADNAGLEYGSENFTVEFWYRFTAVPSTDQYFYSKRANANNYFFIFARNSGWFFDSLGATSVSCSGSTTHVLNVWRHFALVRNGSAFAIYVDGASIASTTSSNSVSSVSAPLDIGWWSGGSLSVNGFIDELRITKGIARYTSNFTPPTAAFPDA